MFFETERLILRPWTEADAEELYKYAKDPHVGPRAGWPAHTSVENSREIIHDILSAEGTYAVVFKETNLPVGSIGIMRNANIPTEDDEVEIGYWIGKPFWGQGIIPEACRELIRYCFEELKCSRIWCGYYNRNENSRRVQEKCGFIYHHSVYDKFCEQMGDYRTEHVTVLTKEHWEELQVKEESFDEPEWKVSFESGFWSDYGWAGNEIPVNRSFQWGDKKLYIPSIYNCPEGLVIDYCIEVEPEKIHKFIEKWDLLERNHDEISDEEQTLIENEHPLIYHFHGDAKVNGVELQRKHSCGISWIPEECMQGQEGGKDSKKAMKHYSLDEKKGWIIHRESYLWNHSRPEKLEDVRLHMASEPTEFMGIRIINPKEGDVFYFVHPVTGCEHILTILECEAQELGEEHLEHDDSMEYPKHFRSMNYKISPELQRDKFSLFDCVQGDSPRTKDGTAKRACSVSTVILRRKDQNSAIHSVCSSLHFEPVEEVEWRMVLREKKIEDMDVKLI